MKRTVSALGMMVGLLLLWVGGGPAGAWDTPPPECTVDQVGDLSVAAPRIAAPRDGRFVPIAIDGTLVSIGVRAGTGDDFTTVPDLLLVEVRRPGGKIVGSFGQSYDGQFDGEWRAPGQERFYTVAALALYGVDGPSPCSVESAAVSFEVGRRTIGVAQVRSRLLGMIRRFKQDVDGATTGGDLIFAADSLDESLDDLSVLRVGSDRATRALDAWIVYARRFSASVRSAGQIASAYVAPGPAVVHRIVVRGRELGRATKRLVKEMRRAR